MQTREALAGQAWPSAGLHWHEKGQKEEHLLNTFSETFSPSHLFSCNFLLLASMQIAICRRKNVKSICSSSDVTRNIISDEQMDFFPGKYVFLNTLDHHFFKLEGICFGGGQW